jgi:transposase
VNPLFSRVFSLLAVIIVTKYEEIPPGLLGSRVTIVTMYVRQTTRRYKDKTYTNYLLVESIHTPKGPRQKVICSLGDLSPRPAEEWLRLARKVEDALVGQAHLFSSPDPEVEQIVRQIRTRQPSTPRPSAGPLPEPGPADLIAVHTDSIAVTQPRSAGPVHIGFQFWKRLGLDAILQRHGFATRAIQLTCAMTLNRLIHPDSEHAMPRWIRSTAVSDILGVDLTTLADDPLYRNLDRLHPNRAAIESDLVERERHLFQLDPTIYLYDLTSTYFEGQALQNPKAKRGYSRDHRPDCPQVVIGLVIGREGFPIAHEIFAGNTQDRKTLGRMLDLLKERVGLPEGATVVVDRGLAYAENLKDLRDRKLHYVVAGRQPERDQWLDEFEDEKGFEVVPREPSPRNRFQEKSQVRVKAITRGKEKIVLCTSAGRTAKDRAIREKQEGRFLADLERLQRRIDGGRLKRAVAIGEAIGRLKERYPRVSRYHTIRYDVSSGKLSHESNAEKKAKAQQLDGGYLLRTDRTDLTAQEAWLMYLTLTRAESAFRSIKTPLAERPIFHHLEHRVETHIFLCILAYHLLVAIETTLLNQGVHTSWATVRETVASHIVATMVLPTDGGKVLSIRKGTTPEPDQLELYRLLNIPAEVMQPIKMWS